MFLSLKTGQFSNDMKQYIDYSASLQRNMQSIMYGDDFPFVFSKIEIDSNDTTISFELIMFFFLNIVWV